MIEKMKKKHLNILIIDDDPVYTRMLEKYLYVNVNCTVLSFETVRICLHARPPQPDIVFLDYYMNDMDGLRATRLLKKRWKKASYVLISSSERIMNKKISRFGVDLAIQKSEGIEQVVSLGLRYHKAKKMFRRSILAVLGLILLGLGLFYFLKA